MIGNAPQLWKTFAFLGDLRVPQKQKGEALQAYRNALKLLIIDKVAAGLEDESLKTTF